MVDHNSYEPVHSVAQSLFVAKHPMDASATALARTDLPRAIDLLHMTHGVARQTDTVNRQGLPLAPGIAMNQLQRAGNLKALHSMEDLFALVNPHVAILAHLSSHYNASGALSDFVVALQCQGGITATMYGFMAEGTESFGRDEFFLETRDRSIETYTLDSQIALSLLQAVGYMAGSRDSDDSLEYQLLRLGDMYGQRAVYERGEYLFGDELLIQTEQTKFIRRGAQTLRSLDLHTDLAGPNGRHDVALRRQFNLHFEASGHPAYQAQISMLVQDRERHLSTDDRTRIWVQYFEQCRKSPKLPLENAIQAIRTTV